MTANMMTWNCSVVLNACEKVLKWSVGCASCRLMRATQATTGSRHRLWNNNDVDQVAIVNTFADIREAAELHQLPPVTGNMVRAAAHLMRPRAGQGVDRLSPLDLERLPPEGVEELASVMNAAEACLTWPWQIY